MLDLSIFDKFDFEFPAVAVKFHFTKPENVKQYEGQLSFCEFLKAAQNSDEPFYVTKENDNCMGKYVLGMVGRGEDLVSESGQKGFAFHVFDEARTGAKLYTQIHTIEKGLVNYVEFAKLGTQTFNPDVLIVMANIEQAEIIMRAKSYKNCELWESVSSSVIGCAWIYSYPYLSGKVNLLTTGMHHGMKRRKTFPAGYSIISIPYNKLPEIAQNLAEMPWKPIGYLEDEEHQTQLKKDLQDIEKLMEDPALKDMKK